MSIVTKLLMCIIVNLKCVYVFLEAFIIYIKESDPERSHILFLSNLLRKCGVNCYVDLYHSHVNVVDWSQWTSRRIRFCISKKGYILLECTQAMFASLEYTEDNHCIQMAIAHVDCNTLKYYVRNHTDRFIPFYTDDSSSGHIPPCLSTKTVYQLPIGQLPQLLLEKKELSDSDLEVLWTPNFVSLRRLITTLTGQKEIFKPPVGKLG